MVYFHFAENLFAWKIRSKNRNERPAIAYVWRLECTFVKIHTSDTIFIEYVCTRSFGRLLARARYKRFLCVLLLIISHGEEVYAQFTWRHHRTYGKLQQGKHSSIFVCICLHVSSGNVELKRAQMSIRLSETERERESNFWWWDTNFTIYAIQNSRNHEVLESSLNKMSC